MELSGMAYAGPSAASLSSFRSPTDPLLPAGVTLGGTVLAALVFVILPSAVAICAVRRMSRRDTPAGMLMSLLEREADIMVPGTCCLFLGSGLVMLVPFFAGQFIRLTITEGAISDAELAKMLLYTGAAGIIACVVQGVRSTLYTLAGERVVCRLRKRVFASLLRQEIAFFDQQASGALISRLTSDMSTLQVAATSALSTALRGAVQLLLSIGILFCTSWRLTLVMVGVLPFMMMSGALLHRFSTSIGEGHRQMAAIAGEVASETFGNIRTVRAFRHGEALMARRYNNAANGTFRHGKRGAVVDGVWTSVLTAAYFIIFISVLWAAVTIARREQLHTRQLVLFVVYTTTLVGSLQVVGSLVPHVGIALTAATKILALAARESVMLDGVDDPGFHCTGLMEFEGVWFAYPSRPGVKVLANVSFVAMPNQLVAIVGSSGSGKSSCLSLVLRLYDVSGGVVRIDGHNLRDVHSDYIRRHVSVVPQEPVLFSASVRANILFGLESPSASDIVDASRLANCHGFVEDLPDGYETQVGERGAQLSGGQKQRVAIARALLADPTILLLDEATSSLDAEAELVVQTALNALIQRRRDRTSLVVAHHFSTVRHADLIVVLERGRVVETGKHADLVEHGAVYRALAQVELEDRHYTNGAGAAAAARDDTNEASSSSQAPASSRMQPLSVIDPRGNR
eukprot:NODE_1276_length_2538_cov_7.414766.p1 GENE.NODE_1276_length_2538_cov_7.414766~~NODE_1276_length_2538_cov_7.414766.p1  ORF type:complete len:686 (-),score=207.51 NODE_1276_length_2538_cov_7.414766:202-2259(-)